MRPSAARGRLWPDARQELLLRAGLMPAPACVVAWARVSPDLDLAGLDRGAARLLPLVWWNLRRHGVEAPLVAQIEARYRATRAANEARLAELVEVLGPLGAAGIPTLLLKGGALLAGATVDLGVRPMSDIDLLVPSARVPDAISLLNRLGWSTGATLTSAMKRHTHSVPLRHPTRADVDLHWHVFEECCRDGDDDALWAASLPVAIGGVSTRIPAPEDQLIHACVHGEKWVRVPGIRWIADAVALVRGGQVRWDRLVEQAVRRRFVLRLRAQLAYLASTFDAPIPPEALAALDAAPVSRLERFEQRWSVRDRRRPWLLVYWCNHVRSAPGGLAAATLTFPRYLQATWRLPSLAGVPGAAVERLGRAWSARRPGSRPV